ncbi:cytosolic thiouridylase subunit Ctu1 [Cichlidogyrus casuarinus]|uniref:Cytoplasmic tRNA 2-thiolation protein 1 n=1 Tax=Cichlidogyrus casuarinus TaxID=1844966 RepID=A0ABD2QKV4_9PLAT
MPLLCCRCNAKGFIKRPKNGKVMCKDCFLWAFEEEVNWTIKNTNMIQPGDRIAIGASGGKGIHDSYLCSSHLDSTVLAFVLKTLNERYNYGADLILLSIDEGIVGYRDDSLETVKRNEKQYELPLTILSYKDLYGWTMDEIVAAIGKKSNCTYCGVFRRQALDRGAMKVGANKICTGHNADDIAETVLMNILRGDIGRLHRCTAAITGEHGHLPRFKPFKYSFEKEIVMYAHARKLDYFSTECKYSPNAYRGYTRELIKEYELIRPRSIIDIIYSGEQLAAKQTVKLPTEGKCERCQFVASQRLCQACLLLEGLNRGMPKVVISGDYRKLDVTGESCSQKTCACRSSTTTS